MERRATRWMLGGWTALVVLFLWLPLALIMVYAFNKSNVQSWPITGFTTHWFGVAWRSGEVRDAIWLSVRAGLLATGVALVLGSAAAFAIARFRFFGRETVSFLLVLPIALPGIITGMALNSFFLNNPAHRLTPSLWTIVIGHTTFCIVIIYNNLLARLRRTPTSLLEASSDLGAHGSTTFRRVVLPLALPGVVAGSIFTFSLTLGDYITPTLVGGSSSQFIGNVVYSSVGIANNVPFAAAFATIPLVVMALYLVVARRAGAFEAL